MKAHTVHRPTKSQRLAKGIVNDTDDQEMAEPAPEPIEQPPPNRTLTTDFHPTAQQPTDRFERAINEIEALVGDRWPISRQVMDIIAKAKSN
jgi:hypothetical protein